MSILNVTELEQYLWQSDDLPYVSCFNQIFSPYYANIKTDLGLVLNHVDSVNELLLSH